MRKRLLLTLWLATTVLLGGQAEDEKDVMATVQKVFDGLAAHDGAIIRAAMLPDARLYSLHGDTAPSGTTVEDFDKRLSGVTGNLLERFTSPPTVVIHGRIAQVWGEYEFLRDGKFGHCGVDSFSLLKTGDSWKVAAVVYTAETTGCKGH